MVNEFGDYQTPAPLVNKIVELLRCEGISPQHLIEPTFGEGSFIKGALSVFKSIEQVSGYEIQEDYYNSTVSDLYNFDQIKLNLIRGSFFEQDLDAILDDRDTLVLGNPPWVTSSTLSSLESKNVPVKSNFKKLSGFDAITGKSNFDISEYISIELLLALSRKKGASVLALLVKNIVAQNILKGIRSSDIKMSKFRLYQFNAKKEFGVSVDASLMLVNIDSNKDRTLEAEVYNLENPNNLIYKFGWDSGNFVSNIEYYDDVKNIDSKSGFVWRSGIKHDASKVMEFTTSSSRPINGYHEEVDIEPNLIYGLLKSSDIRKSLAHTSYRKQVLVTQSKIGANTDWIKYDYPKTWQYLEAHSQKLDGRKSSIYKGKPRYSIFGVGDYSFAPYKIAISGMYKNPLFTMVKSHDGKPIMVDDTVYFLPFYEEQHALIALATLNGFDVQKLLSALSFKDSKRPYTKEILMRIDIQTAASNMGIVSVNKYLSKNMLPHVTEESFNTFISNNKYELEQSSRVNYSPISLF